MLGYPGWPLTLSDLPASEHQMLGLEVDSWVIHFLFFPLTLSPYFPHKVKQLAAIK